MPKHYATSRQVRMSGPTERTTRYSSRAGPSHTRLLGLNALAEDKQNTRERVQQVMSGCSRETAQLINDNSAQTDVNTNGNPGHFEIDINFDPKQDTGEWEDMLPDLPPVFQADEAFVHALRDVTHDRVRTGRWKKGVSKTWRQRRLREESRWGELIEPLADAFLRWKYPPTAADSAPSLAAQNEEPAAPPMNVDYEWTVEQAIDLFELTDHVTISRAEDSTSPAIDLMRNGWVAKTPDSPGAAVSIKTLELFHRLRQRKPSFSAEALTKVICDYYRIPYREHLRRMLADTLEVYMRVMRVVDKRVRFELGRDGENWRVLNACPCCCYKLEDEPPLQFSRLYAIDGNNSLKRICTSESRVCADTRTLSDSDYFLPQEFVDRFANEVKARKGPAVHTSASDVDSDDDEDPSPSTEEGDPTDGVDQSNDPSADPSADQEQALREKALGACVKNWKSAANDESKRMWAIFDESGVFMSACRHGFILWIIDMIRSGELAKYPLAMIAKIIETHEPNTIGGYDIGCSFESTVKKSSLGGLFAEKNSRLCVNAFHGYSHSYLCQLQYHPNIIPGIGLEDLETMERVFSSSNQLASVIRYASRYRRRLYVEAYFVQWDADKYQNLGTFILRNYQQALEMIKQDTETLKHAKVELGVTDADMDQWEEEERVYFAQLGDEEEFDILALTYVELLQSLRKLENSRSQTMSAIIQIADPSESSSYARQAAATRKMEAKRRHVLDQYNQLNFEICDLEVQMGIERGRRWTPATPQYIEALKFMNERTYRRALDKLQKLVVLRLFELHKMNLSQTGYKMRTHLSKSLQTRCKAIKKAVSDYNAAAAALTPPRPPVDWSAVSHYGFLEEFHLLQDTRNDLREKRWAQPVIRNLMKIRNRLARAKEELVRCDVEVRRLHTSIRDEQAHFQTVLSNLVGTSIHGAVEDFVTRRRNVNEMLLYRIYEIYSLSGFTGNKTCGTRVGRAAPLPPDPIIPDSATPVPAVPAPVVVPDPNVIIPAQGVAPDPIVPNAPAPDPIPLQPQYDVEEDDSDSDVDDAAEDETLRGHIAGLVQFVTHL